MKILYFSPIAWGDLKQRPQHLAEELSKYHQVYFVEPSVSFIKSKLDGTKQYEYRKYNINDNLMIIRISGKWRLPKSFDVFDLWSLNMIYEKKQIRKLQKECDIIWLGSPLYFPLIKNKNSKKIIYDKMDDNAQLVKNKFLKILMIKYEKQLVVKASLILVTCNKFYEDIRNINKNVYIVNNGVDCSFATKRSGISSWVVADIKKIKSDGCIIFGYIGTIEHWFDYDAILNILNADDNNYVVLVGRNCIPQIDNSRVRYYDPVLKEQLAAIIDSFDYCLYPFKKSDFLDTIDPVKIYEYLCLNKKVISVRSKETERFEKNLELYSDYHELTVKLKKIKGNNKSFNTNEQLKEFIYENSWQSRVLNILHYLKIFN